MWLALVVALALALHVKAASGVAMNEFVAQDLHNGTVWLLVFSVDWCGHCRSLEPELARVRPRDERFAIATIDCTDRRDFCRHLDVDAFPDVFRVNGTRAWRHEGARTQEALETFLHTRDVDAPPPDRTLVVPALWRVAHWRVAAEVHAMAADMAVLWATQRPAVYAVCAVAASVGAALALAITARRPRKTKQH